MEIEAKFQILSDNQVATLKSARHLMNYRLGVGSDIETSDFYFDSASFHLLRHGLSLRLRNSLRNSLRNKGTGWLVTVKGLSNEVKAAIHTRLEIEETLAPSFAYSPEEGLAIKLLPTTIQDALAPALDDEHNLRLLCQIDQRRHKRLLLGKDEPAQPWAEVSIDEVEVIAGIGEVPNEGKGENRQVITHFHELEVEILDGTNKAWLSELTTHLHKMPGLKTSKQSKFERALYATYLPAFGSSDSTISTAEFFRKIWLTQLFEMLGSEAEVRSEDGEAVHDMRVAIRRMRGAARLFGDHFQYSKIAPFLKRLRHTARLLGQVRDLDVAHERLQPAIDNAESNDQRELALLGTRWRTQRTAHHVDLDHWLNSRKYSKFITRFFEFCCTPGAGSKDLPLPGEPPIPPYEVRHVLPSLLVEHYASVRAFESVLLEQKDSVPTETLHALRIECKYLRYALEFSLPLLGESGEVQVDHLKRLQTLLGDLNDAAVNAHMLGELPMTSELTAVGRYRTQQYEIVETCRKQVLSELRTFLGAESRRQLLRTIARI